MESLKVGNLQIDVGDDQAARKVSVWWRGTSDERHPGRTLEPFFQKLLEEVAAGSSAIEMHFETIEYFNSATIGSIVQLIKDARAKATKLTIFYSGKQKWQELSFRAMKAFDKNDGLIQFQAT